MIDHTGVVVSDFEAGKRFYERALGAIGPGKLREFPAAVTGHTDVAGFGPSGKAEFWISAATAGQGSNKPPVHVAFRVDTRANVDTFYARPWLQAAPTMAGPACARTIIRTTTAPSCATRTATTSRPSATHLVEALEAFRAGEKKGTRRCPFSLKCVRLTWRVPPSCWCPAYG